ncbi:hypothetical protein EI94DRAFT_1701342 [Lactarius quietus]|nr:hypothetical protein EI94DRAFT_1701342 [Lactarius quietus]
MHARRADEVNAMRIVRISFRKQTRVPLRTRDDTDPSASNGRDKMIIEPFEIWCGLSTLWTQVDRNQEKDSWRARLVAVTSTPDNRTIEPSERSTTNESKLNLIMFNMIKFSLDFERMANLIRAVPPASSALTQMGVACKQGRKPPSTQGHLQLKGINEPFSEVHIMLEALHAQT